MFPVKIGNEIDVKRYSESLIKGEQQLLITVEGNAFITNGDGTLSEFNGNNAGENILKLNKLIKEIDASKSNMDHEHNESYYTKGESDTVNLDINKKIIKISGNVDKVKSGILDLNLKLDNDIDSTNKKIERNMNSVIATVDEVKKDIILIDKISTSTQSKLDESIKINKNNIDRIDKNLLTLSNDIANLSKEVNNKIEEIKNKVYTKDEIDKMNIPASRITVDVLNNGITTNMTMQDAINVLFSGAINPPIPPKPTGTKCGTFKVGSRKCGENGVENTSRSICGTFKAGQRKCNQ